MKHRFFILLCILCAQVLKLAAQDITLSGTVTDRENNKALSNVIVMIKDKDKKNIIKYTQTAGDGQFTIQANPTSANCISFSLMGYETQEYVLSGTNRYFKVSLKSKPLQIKEVIVKASKIRNSGDTITYNVSSFADVQDKTIGDVLKKMPGIEVEKSGKVYYNGKSINKFYIEGLDMLEGRYGIATNTIPQRDVSCVEVLENHQPVKALKKIQFSDRAALNIKLKKEARARWIMTANAGFGLSPALWTGELSAMRFKSKGQQMTTYKTNNTGNNITAQHGTLTIDDILNQIGNNYSLPSYIHVSPAAAPNLDEERTLFNRSHTFSNSSLFKLNKEYQMTTKLFYAHDRNTSDYTTRTDHFLADSLIISQEDENTRTRIDELNGEITLLANTDNYYLKNILSADLKWTHGNSTATGSYPNSQQAHTSFYKVNNNLQLLKRFGDKSLTITSVNNYQSHPEHLLVTRNNKPQQQDIKAAAFFTNTNVAYSWSFSSFLLSLSNGISGIIRSLDSKLTGVPDSLGALDMNNRLRYLHVYASPSLQYKHKSWVITFNAPIHYYSCLNNILFSPRLYLHWDITSQWFVILNGQLSFLPTTDGNYYMGILMKNYRYLQAGYSQMEKNRNTTTGFSLHYKNPIKAFFANMRMSYSRNSDAYTSQQLFQGDYIVTSYLPECTHNESYQINGSVSKGFDWTNLVSTLNISYTDSRLKMNQNGVMQPYRSSAFRSELKFVARPSQWCNLDYALMYSRNRLKTEQNNSNTNHVRQSLKIVFSPGNKWQFDINGEHYYNTLTEKQAKSLILLNAGLRYSLSKECEVCCGLTNLLNKQHYSYTLYNGLSQVFSSYEIRPFNALFSLYYNF